MNFSSPAFSDTRFFIGETVANRYRYGFNGKEKDDEVHGSSGTSYDYGFRIYDPRVGRYLTLDPLMKKYPFESNYTYVANNPLLFTDQGGRDRIYYLNVILNDGTTLHVSTVKVVNNEVSLHYASGTGTDGMGGTGHFYATDVRKTVTVDLRTQRTTVSALQDDYANSHSASYYIEKKGGAVLDGLGKMMNLDLEGSNRGEQAGGFRFTADWAAFVDGSKTSATKEDAQTIDITALEAALTTLNAQVGKIPDIKEGLGAAEFIKLLKDFHDAYKDIKEQITPIINSTPNNNLEKSQTGQTAQPDKTSVSTENAKGKATTICPVCGGTPSHFDDSKNEVPANATPKSAPSFSSGGTQKKGL